MYILDLKCKKNSRHFILVSYATLAKVAVLLPFSSRVWPKRPPHSAFFAVSLTTIPSMGSVAALPATAADVAALSNATSSTTLTSADATCVCVSAVSISISPSRAASAISVVFDTTLGSISATKPLSLECNVNTAIVEVEMMLFFTTIVFVELALVSSPAIVSAVTVLVEFPAALSTPLSVMAISLTMVLEVSVFKFIS
ncbi:hypothetical protein GQX74_003842 [Glossina fuscipes]|nr:hypothetical protein GQX74_003842 [Glossina fuscipes]